MTVTLAQWTLDDYHRMIEVGLLSDRRVELLNGEIIEMPPEGPEHAQRSTDISDYLKQLLGNRALVRDGHPITIPGSHSEPQPDLAIVQPSRSIYYTRHPYPDEVFWLIELSNTSLTIDLDTKLKAYGIAEIQEYWVVDLKNRCLNFFRDLVAGEYCTSLALTKGDISPLAFPDRIIAVSRLL